MKRFIISLLLPIISSVALHAQTNLLDEEQDTLVNVVAYFCKNDTMTYRIHSLEYRIQETDTIVKEDIVEDVMIVVTDSTSKGYTLELTSLDMVINEAGNDFMESLLKYCNEATKGMKCIFKTDEYGSVKSISNWRELRDKTTKACKEGLDRVFAENPDFEKVLNRKSMEGALLAQYSTEENIRASYEELGILFEPHGEAYSTNLEEADFEDNGFPSHFWLMANYTPQEEEGDFEGDYSVLYKSQTTVPIDDLAPLMESMIYEYIDEDIIDNAGDNIASAIDELKKQSDSCEVTVFRLFDLFYNGWPKSCEVGKITKMGNTQKIEETQIEWLSRSWYNY